MSMQLARLIIEIGKNEKYVELENFPNRPDKAYNVIPRGLANHLGIEELASLIKGFSVVEHTKFGEFGIGSPTPTKWFFNLLKKKVTNNPTEENITILEHIAEWLNNSSNYYSGGYNSKIDLHKGPVSFQKNKEK